MLHAANVAQDLNIFFQDFASISMGVSSQRVSTGVASIIVLFEMWKC